MLYLTTALKNDIDGFVVGTTDVASFSVARNLGTWFDFYFNLQEQIHNTCFPRFFLVYSMFTYVNCLQNAAANVPTVT